MRYFTVRNQLGLAPAVFLVCNASLRMLSKSQQYGPTRAATAYLSLRISE
jgi:hypothetical protein